MNEAPQTNMRIIMIVVTTLCVNATVGLSVLGYCLVFGVKPDQVLLTAFISIITGLLGIIGGMLTKTSPTETTKIATIPAVTPVKVVNAPADPVPTEEQKV